MSGLERLRSVNQDLADTYELVAMAGVIRRYQKGMLGFWKLNRKSSASMEGFNGKVRWLMKQAHGFRDFKFLRLKIFDLPSTDTKRHL